MFVLEGHQSSLMSPKGPPKRKPLGSSREKLAGERTVKITPADPQSKMITRCIGEWL